MDAASTISTISPPFRRRLGRIWYTWKRHGAWLLGNAIYAKAQQDSLPYLVFQHSSPLLRPLKGVDMYLQRNKITNLRLAANHLDGLIIKPGETFSFWHRVGKPTARRGFLEGLVLEGGRIGKGIGGGLCQMGNLLYWMALHSPLTVVERWRHSYDVFPDEGRTLPFGSGATLAWNYIDLQCRNETEQPIQVRISFSETHLLGEIRANKVPEHMYQILEKNHRIQHEPWGGYSRHNQLVRQTLNRQSAEILLETTIAENHALMMYPPFIETGIERTHPGIKGSEFRD